MRVIRALVFLVVLAAAGVLGYLLVRNKPVVPAPVPQVAAPPVDVSNLPTVDLRDGPEPAADAIVFDMAYRGLGADDKLRYNSYWGFGSQDTNTPFLEAVRKTAGDVKAVYNPNFKGAEWSAVALDRDQPTALYFDLNADGELADCERILPVGEPDRYGQIDFVTPDFLMTTEKGVQTPFRALLRARKGGGSAMWSPSCVLEGAAKVNGRDIKLVLMTNGFTGSFFQFGRCSYMLQDTVAAPGQYTSRQPLSSLITHEGQFYTLRLLKHSDKEGLIRAVLEKDTTPTGELAVSLLGAENIKARLGSARIKGAEDDTIQFSVSGGRSTTLPEGKYKLDSGYLYYGVAGTDERNVNFTSGPPVEITAGETVTVELGRPRMIVSAIDQKNRYSSNVQDQFSYSKGTVIFLSPRVEGLAGEKYERFRASEDIAPTFEILGAGAKRVASGSMEYG